jgi:hypothetical protein
VSTTNIGARLTGSTTTSNVTKLETKKSSVMVAHADLWLVVQRNATQEKQEQPQAAFRASFDR